MDRLKDKVAIITGGSRGIGAATAKLFVQEGAAVAIWDIRESRGKAVVEELNAMGGKAIYIQCDVSKAKEVDTAVDETVRELGIPKILFNNAGIVVVGTLEELTEEQWDHQYNVNVKSMFLVSRRIIPLMRKVGGGSIINNASESAFVGFPMHPCYCSSKAAVVHLTRSMAVCYAKENIRVNSICPGTIWTEITEDFLSQQKNPEAVLAEIKGMHPLGLGEVNDIGWAVVYMASDESKYMTGSAILVDGGITSI